MKAIDGRPAPEASRSFHILGTFCWSNECPLVRMLQRSENELEGNAWLREGGTRRSKRIEVGLGMLAASTIKLSIT